MNSLLEMLIHRYMHGQFWLFGDRQVRGAIETCNSLRAVTRNWYWILLGRTFKHHLAQDHILPALCSAGLVYVQSFQYIHIRFCIIDALLNFRWVNRKDPEGRNIFAGGFLGLDNIGVFDRSKPLPTGGFLEQVPKDYIKYNREKALTSSSLKQ